jgi:hypothetical protein
MKNLTSRLVVLLCIGSTSLFSQVIMKVDDVLVASGGVYQYTATAPPSAFGDELMTLDIENASSAEMSISVERCKIIDVTGWEVHSTVWAVSDDPFGGIHFSNSTMTGTCWTTLNALDVSIGASALLGDYLNSADVSCCLYRYYVWNGAILEDSLDVEFCRASLDVLSLSADNISLFPNPANTLVHISSNAGLVESGAVYDVSGKKIKNIMLSNNMTIDVREIPNGIYYVLLNSYSGVVIRKKMIVKH